MTSVRLVMALLGRRYRGLATLVGLTRFVELVAIFAMATYAARGEHLLALSIAAGTSCLTVLRAWVQAWLTDETRRTIFDRVADALLRADPLVHDVPEGAESESL